MQPIVGVRHKCLSCPDWDYCSTCILSASQIHPGHRFAPLFEQIADLGAHEEVHFGIYCDGPLCASKPHKQYISGTRYKCAVCHDTDFCANCEAVPSLRHNRTHPLIKFKTSVRHVSVTTLGEKNNGQSMSQMGDRPSARNAATETTPVDPPVSTATQVQTVAEVEPVDVPVVEKVVSTAQSKNIASELQALFESDSMPDGSKLTPSCLFTQSWTIRNPGPHVWPAGSAVYFTGGDHMLNVDTKNPSSVTAMAAATKSNALEESVEAGQIAVFTVLLKSPEREGRAISYWRLKTPDAIPFGHKLWVDITVTAAPIEVVAHKQPEVVEIAKELATDEEKTGHEAESEESSTMIFPKLDKESPVSSVHDLAAPAPVEEAKATAKAEDDELVEELESLAFEDQDETDDGFMTDEEYDILDASDEDLLMEARNAGKQ
jgi:next to BRCA1 gene 1 protein